MGTLRVLVVDDEPGVLLTFAANLELAGLDVTTASSSQAAIDAASKKGPFDLLITDFRMPGMTGAELIRRLRGLQPGIPVILMTAFANETVVREVLEEGVFTVVTKPFEVKDVVKMAVRAARRPFVLVVDAAKKDGAALAAALEEQGLRSRSVQSAGEALLAVGMDNVDVCIVELRDPKEGPALTADIRAKKPEVSVIAISAEGDSDAFAKTAEAGAVGCISRPFDPPALVRLIARARGMQI